MAVAFVNAGTFSHVAGAATLAPALPASIVPGNLGILVASGGDNQVLSQPSGWFRLIPETLNTTALIFNVFWRIFKGGEAAPTMPRIGGQSAVAQIFQYSGNAARGVPFSAVTFQSNASSVTVTAPDLTPSFPNQMIVFIGACANATTASPISFSGYTGTNPTFAERGDNQSGDGTTEVGQFLADGLNTSGTAIGSRTATSAFAGVNVGLVAAIREATPNTIITNNLRPGIFRPGVAR